MNIAIDKAHINVSAEGCLNCGTKYSNDWHCVRFADVTINGITRKLPLHLCDACGNTKTVAFGEKLALGNMRIIIHNATKYALRFSFAGADSFFALPQTNGKVALKEVEGDYDALEVDGIEALGVYIVAQPDIEKTRIDLFCHERGKRK